MELAEEKENRRESNGDVKEVGCATTLDMSGDIPHSLSLGDLQTETYDLTSITAATTGNCCFSHLTAEDIENHADLHAMQPLHSTVVVPNFVPSSTVFDPRKGVTFAETNEEYLVLPSIREISRINAQSASASVTDSGVVTSGTSSSPLAGNDGVGGVDGSSSSRLASNDRAGGVVGTDSTRLAGGDRVGGVNRTGLTYLAGNDTATVNKQQPPIQGGGQQIEVEEDLRGLCVRGGVAERKCADLRLLTALPRVPEAPSVTEGEAKTEGGRCGCGRRSGVDSGFIFSPYQPHTLLGQHLPGSERLRTSSNRQIPRGPFLSPSTHLHSVTPPQCVVTHMGRPTQSSSTTATCRRAGLASRTNFPGKVLPSLARLPSSSSPCSRGSGVCVRGRSNVNKTPNRYTDFSGWFGGSGTCRTSFAGMPCDLLRRKETLKAKLQLSSKLS